MTTLMSPWSPGSLPDPDFTSIFALVPDDGRGGTPFPSLNVWCDDDTLLVEAELPGVPRDALEITVEGDELFLAGERREAPPGDGVEHRRERATGRFSRVVCLPFEVEAAAVEANLRDGVLTVRMPRSPAARPRRIAVSPANAASTKKPGPDARPQEEPR